MKTEDRNTQMDRGQVNSGQAKRGKSALPPDFLPFTNDFIFSLVMRDPEICRGILEAVLPDEEFSEIKMLQSPNPLIDDEVAVTDAGRESSPQEAEKDARTDTDAFSAETQKSLKFARDMHGVRFDAFIKSENLWAEVEMQTSAAFPLGKRARYYQANMDLDCLEQGQDYTKLKKSYVIFICTFDYFQRGEAVYFFRSWDVEKGLPLDDFSYTIVLNTACAPERVPEALRPLYGYLNDPQESQASALTQKIDARVRKFNADEWRRKYMTFEHMLNERERAGIEQGRAQGRAEGETIGLKKGRAQGRSEGAAQEKREIAKAMKARSMPLIEIVALTGLTAEEVKKL